MVFFNWATMQMAAKIVYYGPGLCGKTTNLSYIYAKTSPNSRGEMVSLETESDRTLFFDLLPIEVGTIGGFKTRLQLYTVPGQVFYNTTRKLVLKGVDGVVFVADSQRPMREANVESLKNLRANLAELGLDMDEIPVVLQYNKRDLKNVLNLDELDADLNAQARFPAFEASAIAGDGVFETLKEITKLTLKKLRRRMASPQASAGPRLATPPLSSPRPAPRPPSSVSAAALARAAEEGVEAEAPTAGASARAVAGAAAPAEAIPFPARTPQGDVGPEPDHPEAAPAPTPEEVTAGPAPEEVTASSVPDSFEAADGSGAEPVSAAFEPPPASAVEAPPGDTSSSGAEDLDEPEELTDADMVVDEDLEVAAASATPAPTEDVEPEQAAPAESAESELQIEFEQDEEGAAEVAPPPMKHVHVSNQMDILAELESLRKQATMATPSPRKSTTPSPAMDLDSLLAGDVDHRRELRRKVAEKVNSRVLERLRRVRVAVELQGEDGESLHELEPFALSLEGETDLQKLCLLLTIDLESKR